MPCFNNCSNNGKCDSHENCVCNEGFLGYYCEF